MSVCCESKSKTTFSLEHLTKRTPQFETNYTFSIDKPGKWQVWFPLFKNKPPELPPAPPDGNYAETEARKLILEAINGTIQSLKLNVEVKP